MFLNDVVTKQSHIHLKWTRRERGGDPLRRDVTSAPSSTSRRVRSGRRARDDFHGAQRWLRLRVCSRGFPISAGPGFGIGKPFRVEGGRGCSRVGTEGSCPAPLREGPWPEAAACLFPLRPAWGEGVAVTAVHALWPQPWAGGSQKCVKKARCGFGLAAGQSGQGHADGPGRAGAEDPADAELMFPSGERRGCC